MIVTAKAQESNEFSSNVVPTCNYRYSMPIAVTSLQSVAGFHLSSPATALNKLINKSINHSQQHAKPSLAKSFYMNSFMNDTDNVRGQLVKK